MAQTDKPTRQSGMRPMRDLLLSLPLLVAVPGETIHYEASDADALIEIAERAEIIGNTINLGLVAIGHVMACAAPEIECGDVPGDTVEALGFLIAELSDFAAVAFTLSQACRRYTYDHAPPSKVHVACTRP